MAMSSKESDFPFFSYHRLRIASLPTPTHAGILTGLILCKSCADNHRCCELICPIAVECSEVSISQLSSSLYSDILSIYSSPCSLSLGWKEIDRDDPSTVIYSQHFDRLWVSALIITHCKKKILWLKLRATRIDGHKQKYLEGSWIAWLFTTITAVDCP